MDISIVADVPAGFPAIRTIDWSFALASKTLGITPTTYFTNVCISAITMAAVASVMSLAIAIKFANQFDYLQDV